MKFDHKVKYNGTWYLSGDEIPEENHNAEESKELPTKSAINRRSTAELQTFAKEQGIADAEALTGTELKKVLIEKFEL